MSTVERATVRASEYIGEAMEATTLDELRAIYRSAVRAGLGPNATAVVIGAVEKRRAQLTDRDEVAMTVLARELGARLIETRPAPDPTQAPAA